MSIPPDALAHPATPMSASLFPPPALTCPSLGVPHGFFTRVGGVSTGPYASLNGSLSGGDDPIAVAANRARVADSLNLPHAHLLGLTQVHSARVVVVSEPWAVGAEADAMVTAARDIGLCIITADCAPVLFADAQFGVIGAAHAGWRGIVTGVLEATVQAMRDLGATRITACVGPAIAQHSYQVGADLRDAVLANEPAAARFFTEDPPDTERADINHWHFDLPGWCAARLGDTGAMPRMLGVDTCDDPTRFFSHRRRTLAASGPIGHQMSVIRR